MQPEVSVIIATHNHAHFLPECLASVRAQTYQDYEVIVVDNGSTDNTAAVVKKLAWDKLRYHYQENTGSVAGPRNTGIRLARGKYVAFLDSDDLWRPNKLERVMAVLAGRPDIDIISHDLHIFEKGKPEADITDRVGPLGPDMFRQLLTVGNCLNGSATVIAKSAFDKFGGFDESRSFVHAEDYETWLRLAYNGCKFYFINETLGDYRIHGSNLSGDFELLKRNWLNVLNKYYKLLKGEGFFGRTRLRRRSFSLVYFMTAARHRAKKDYLRFVENLAYAFVLAPLNLIALVRRRNLEKKRGITGNIDQ